MARPFVNPSHNHMLILLAQEMGLDPASTTDVKIVNEGSGDARLTATVIKTISMARFWQIQRQAQEEMPEIEGSNAVE